jgi:hypothetical protein
VCCLLAVLAAAALTSSATAATVTYGPASFGPATTNWSSNLSLPKWDPALFPGQVLTGVSFTLNGNVTGNASFESLDGAPATINLNLQSTITLTDPNSNVLVTVIPVANISAGASAFDGVIDFGGTSGNSYIGLSGSASNSGSSGNLALFTGSGNILLPVSAAGTSSASGAGNLITQFSTTAGADASVTYTYTAVPEPSTIALAGLGLIALVGLARRRSK